MLMTENILTLSELEAKTLYLTPELWQAIDRVVLTRLEEGMRKKGQANRSRVVEDLLREALSMLPAL